MSCGRIRVYSQRFEMCGVPSTSTSHHSTGLLTDDVYLWFLELSSWGSLMCFESCKTASFGQQLQR